MTSQKEVGKNCNAGTVDIITATIATQAAISMIQKAEIYLLSSVFGGLPAEDSYQSFAGMMVMVETLTKGIDPMKDGQVDVTPFDDFTLLPSAPILLKSHIAAMSNKESSF